jgi:UDP-N-acetylmuramate--alanine ligase
MNQRMGRIHCIHFVGIGGSGMNGIAEVLANLGYRVQGSDLTAVAADNPEVLAARERRIPVVPRAEMLGELMRFRESIAIAGTHGKTTTTSLVASILAEGGLDPTFVIGGRLQGAGTNARLGTGKYLVAEADESDASFLHLQPVMAIVTNIDNDHLATHGGDFERLKNSFVEFLHNLPFYGLAVLCTDDAEVRSILDRVSRPLIRYGIDPGADLRATQIQRRGLKTAYVAEREGRRPLPVTVNLPGLHNVRNSLAAIAIAQELRIADSDIQRALAGFQGVDRRLQHVGDVRTGAGLVSIVDDYGHHPTEIAATLDAVRQAYAGRRIVLAFQPHRYSRTRDLFDDFASAFHDTDVLVLTEIYAAGEDKIPGVDVASLAEAVRAHGHRDVRCIPDLAEVVPSLAPELRSGDLVITLGAGNVSTLGPRLLAALREGGRA